MYTHTFDICISIELLCSITPTLRISYCHLEEDCLSSQIAGANLAKKEGVGLEGMKSEKHHISVHFTLNTEEWLSWQVSVFETSIEIA